MNFFANPMVFQNNFTLPSTVVDNHLKLAGAVQLKVLLYVMRHLSEDPTEADIAASLNIHNADVLDALNYWATTGILIPKDMPSAIAPAAEKTADKPAKKTPQPVIKPTREEIARRGSENEQILFLLREAQAKFGRMLKTSEASTLVWLYDDEGMDSALILMLIEYAVSENKCNIRFIERTATEWINSGVTTIIDAEKYMATKFRQKSAWRVVENAFGLEQRMPSTKEAEYAEKWISEWGYGKDILGLAYDKCVDAKSKFIMSYVAKILESWHKSGYKTAEDVKKAEKTEKPAKNNFSTHDIDLIEQMINKGYGE